MLVATAVALSTFSACGSPTSSGSSPAASAPDTSVSSDNMTADPGHDPRGKAEERKPEDGLVDPYPVNWDKSRRHGRRVTLFYYSGVKDCYGLHHVDVVETSRKVTVTLYDGRRPEAEMCIELAVRVRTTVTLDRPLGDRTLVDGAE